MKLTPELINKSLKFKGERVSMPVSVWAKIANSLSFDLPECRVSHNHWYEIRGDHMCPLCHERFDLPIEPILK